MKRIRTEIKDGKITRDFEGFAGETCSDEADIIMLLSEKMGVRNNVEYSDFKGEEAAERITESDRLRH